MTIARTGYIDADVIVECAVDETRTFTEYDDGSTQEFGGTSTLDAWLATIEAEAMRLGIEVEVYLQRHEHALEVEDCSCAQYETDHHPEHVFGPSGSGETQ